MVNLRFCFSEQMERLAKMEKGLIGTKVVTQIGILVNDNAKTQPTLTLKINIIEKNHRY